MSLTPSTPNLRQTVKSFWDRREGTTGKIFLALAAFAIGTVLFLGWSAIVPFILGVVADTVQLVLLCAFLALCFFLATNKKIHILVKNAFQLAMRWLTGAFIEIDPIGILKNNLNEMKKKKGEFEENLATVAGSKKSLELSIAKKKQAIAEDKGKVQEVDRMLSTVGNDQMGQLKRQQLTLNRTMYLNDAGMKMSTVDKLSVLLKQTDKMYEMLYRWSNLADFNIQNTQNQVENLAEERKSILAASAALGAAKRLLKGDPEQLQLVDQTLEFLADDTAAKLGAMDDFARYSEKFLTDMDIETGASASGAEAKFAEFEQRMLQDGRQNVNIPIATVQNTEGVYVPVEKTNDYNKYFN
jgi:hypothetical protein